MSDKNFNQIKNDLIKVKQCVDFDLEDEVNRNWSEIGTQRYVFDRLKREIYEIEDLKISEIKKWWEDNNVCGNKENFKKLSVQVGFTQYNFYFNTTNLLFIGCWASH